MGLGHAPSIVTDGLVLCLDAANYKSFKGVPATNILNQITYSQGNTNTALYKYTQGTENVNIPSLGYVNSKFVDIYNDYNGGSGACCPNLFTFGNGATMVVSPSTTYTYSIIYKTTTGYTHPNYMYRYERNSAGTVLTEAGVHSTNNRTSLGDGWWFAWGQFTTQATTAYLDTYLFHYEYATQNRVYVYKAALYAGTYIIPPEHMLDSAQVRGTTVATGGGWADIIGRGNNGELLNVPTYTSTNSGFISFNGTNQAIIIPNSTALDTQTPSVEVWVKTNATSQLGFWFEKGEVNTQYALFQEAGAIQWRMNIGGITNLSTTTATYMNTTNWYQVVGTYTSGTRRLYINGTLVNSDSQIGTINTDNRGMSIGVYGGYSGSRGYYYNGNIASVKVYNKALSAAEISQNFNALRGRFGI